LINNTQLTKEEEIIKFNHHKEVQ